MAGRRVDDQARGRRLVGERQVNYLAERPGRSSGRRREHRKPDGDAAAGGVPVTIPPAGAFGGWERTAGRHRRPSHHVGIACGLVVSFHGGARGAKGGARSPAGACSSRAAGPGLCFVSVSPATVCPAGRLGPLFQRREKFLQETSGAIRKALVSELRTLLTCDTLQSRRAQHVGSY